MAEANHSRFSIYKISNLAGCRSALGKKSYFPCPLIDSYSNFELFLSSPYSKSPKWVGALRDIVRQPESLDGIENRTHSFVLLVSFPDSVFAVCGGLGVFAIQAFTQEGFGLDIVSRVVEPDRIKFKRSRHLAGKTAEEQSVYKEYYNYQFDTSNWGKITKEILGEIQQIDLSNYFGLTITSKHKLRLDGKNSLSINKSVTIEDLKILIEKINEIQKFEKKFKILNGYEEISGKDLKIKLVSAFLIELNKQFGEYLESPDNFEETNIGVSYAETKEFLFCDSFEIKSGGRILKLDDTPDLATIFGFFKKVLDISSFGSIHLDKVEITGYKDNLPAINDSLKAFLYAEIKYNGKLHFYIDKKWFRVNDDFEKWVNSQIEEVLSKSSTASNYLPSWNTTGASLETEDAYIERVCAPNSKLLKLHTKHIILRGNDKSEICDIVDIRNGSPSFIFVKKGLGTKFRELLAQSRSSAELFQMDPRFTEKAKLKIKEANQNNEVLCETSNIELVLAFTDHVKNRSSRNFLDRLATVVKTDLIYTLDFLRQLDYKARVIFEIPHT